MSIAPALEELVVDVGDPVDFDELLADDLARGAFALPAVPAVAAFTKNARPAEELARLVGLDRALAADVIRLANTPPFASKAGADTLPRACARLGDRDIVRLCLASTLCGVALRSGPLVALRRRHWRESLASALVCEALATTRELAPDAAYLAGLLHDFGKVLALAFIESRLASSADVSAGEPVWLRIVERHHVDVGWHLAETWKLPKPVPELIAAHHEDMRPGTVPMLDILRTTDDVVKLMTSKPTLTADDIAAIDGIVSYDEAATVLFSLAPLSPMLRALSDVPAPAPPPPPRPAPQPLPRKSTPHARAVDIPTTTLGARKARGLMTVSVSRASLVMTSPVPLSAGWVEHIELQTMPKPMRLFVTIVSVAKQNGVFVIEAKPMALTGALKDEWFRFVDSWGTRAA